MWLWHELGLDGASEAHQAARWRRVLLDEAQEARTGYLAAELEPVLSSSEHGVALATLRAGVPAEPALLAELERRLETASDDEIRRYAYAYANVPFPSSSPSSSGRSSTSSSSTRPRPRKAPPMAAKKKKARKPSKRKKARKPKARKPKARKPKARKPSKPKARKPSKPKAKRKRGRTMTFGEFARRMGATLIG